MVVKPKHVIPEAKGIGIWTKQGQKPAVTSKADFAALKDKRRKKLQKRLAQVKELDAAKEKEKNKWHSFNTKAHNKHMKASSPLSHHIHILQGVRKVTTQRETRDTAGTEQLALARKVYNQSEYQRP